MRYSNLRAWLVLGGIVLAYPVISWAVPASPASMESSSERIGWGAAADVDHIAREIHERVNDERAARGLPPLAWHEGLATSARRWSEEMIATSYGHSTPEFRAHPDFVGTGENIFMGPRSSDELHVGWMRSDGHRENILHPDYTAIGIGVVCRNDGTMWATQIFGLPSTATPGPSQPPTPVNPIEREEPGATCPVARPSDLIFGRR